MILGTKLGHYEISALLGKGGMRGTLRLRTFLASFCYLLWTERSVTARTASRFSQICFLLSLLLTAIPAVAQTTETSFEELSSILREGDSIRLDTVTGVRLRGRFERMSSDTLTLTADGDRQDLPQARYWKCNGGVRIAGGMAS